MRNAEPPVGNSPEFFTEPPYKLFENTYDRLADQLQHDPYYQEVSTKQPDTILGDSEDPTYGQVVSRGLEAKQLCFDLSPDDIHLDNPIYLDYKNVIPVEFHYNQGFYVGIFTLAENGKPGWEQIALVTAPEIPPFVENTDVIVDVGIPGDGSIKAINEYLRDLGANGKQPHWIVSGDEFESMKQLLESVTVDVKPTLDYVGGINSALFD